MKKILSIFAAVLAFAGCQNYEYNTDFEMPTQLSSPSAVTLDVTSTENVVLSWTGGGAADGGILLYNVLFDKEGGNFSDPIYTCKSDLGSEPQLTISQATLNIIARKAGIAPNQTGNIIWTITGAKGGEIRQYNGFQTITITRGEGIDNIPEHLYVAGSAAKEAGQEFRCTEEGVYVIYTRLGEGKLKFTSEADGTGNTFYADSNSKLNEGDGAYDVTAAPESGLARITVDFNTLAFTVEEIGSSVRCIWGATYSDIAILEYQGNGVFVGDGDVDFYGPGTNHDDNPSWCTWVEERYYFIATVNGTEVCWGSNAGGNAITPDGTEEFFYVYEFTWDQWNNLWKMDHAYDDCHVTFTLNTNLNGHMTHSYTGGAITYDQPKTPAKDLFLYGTGAEQEGQEFRKESDGVFVIYSKLPGGSIQFRDSKGTRYFANDKNALYEGNSKSTVEASTGVTRITVNFNNNTVSYDEIGTDVRLIWGCNYETIATLTYQGLGKFVGEGDVVFVDPTRAATNPPSWLSWTEERYYFIPTINGTEMCWGRLDDQSAERPDGDVDARFYNIGEFSWDQWSHLWKMASALDNSHVTVTINTNDNGAMTHSFVKASSEPVTPAITPSDLTISGKAAETSGRAFRKVSDNVFSIITTLKEGKLCFKSGSKNYFYDSEKGLLEGDGDYTVSATSSDALATRITVDFAEHTVKAEDVTYVKCIFGCNYHEIMNFKYTGDGKFKGKGKVSFVQPGDPEYGIATWLTWTEERYYYIATIGGSDYCWGRVDGADAERPDGDVADNFWQIGEFSWSQWDHLWKFASAMDGKEVTIVLDTDAMTQTLSK